MALIVIIGGTESDSFVTLAEFTAYATKMGWTIGRTDDENEQALRRAAQSLTRQHMFRGYRQYQFQALSFPRVRMGLVRGWPVNPDTIPQDIKDAQCELAYLILNGLDPFETIEQSVTRAKAGPVEVETVATGRPRIIALTGLLGPYLSAGAGQQSLWRA